MQKKYAVLNSLGDATFFVDAATSGKTAGEDREAGKAMFRQLRKGDHVILTKLNRAFRRLADCVVVLEKFERLAVKLHICNLMGGAIDRVFDPDTLVGLVNKRVREGTPRLKSS
jgi:DNA invertase Pin-like site-specific DNA recombinase